MKFKPKFPLILITLLALFLTSCDCMYTEQGFAELLQNKTTISDFSQLNDPFVLQLPAGEIYKHKFNSHKDSISKTGKVFVVYDWEKNEVFDWVYCEGEFGIGYTSLTKIQDNYYYSYVYCTELCYINSKGGKIQKIEVPQNWDFINFSSSEQYNILKFPGFDGMYFSFFNDDTKELSEWKYQEGTVSTYRVPSDEDGNFYLMCKKNDANWNLLKLGCKTETIESLYNFNNSEVYCDVLYADENFCIYDTTIQQQKYLKPELFFYDFAEGKSYQIKPAENYADSILADYFYSIVKVGERYFAITRATGESDVQELIQIFEIDMDTLTYNRATNKKCIFRYAEDIKVRGNRIYFSNTLDNFMNIKYIYYDVDEDKFSSEVNVSFVEIMDAWKAK